MGSNGECHSLPTAAEKGLRPAALQTVDTRHSRAGADGRHAKPMPASGPPADLP